MAAQGGGAETDGDRELTGASRPFAEQFDDPATVGFGDRRQRAVDRLGCYFQVGASIVNPVARSASPRETIFTVWAKVQTCPSGSRAE
jgi:hypothetical protein